MLMVLSEPYQCLGRVRGNAGKPWNIWRYGKNYLRSLPMNESLCQRPCFRRNENQVDCENLGAVDQFVVTQERKRRKTVLQRMNPFLKKATVKFKEHVVFL